MEHKDHLSKELEQTLGSLDSITSATPKPFFFGRLENRMENRLKTAGSLSWRLTLGFSVGFLMLVMNAYILMINFSSRQESMDEIELMAEDYRYSSSIYDLNEE